LGEQMFDLIYRYPTFYNIAFTEEGVGLLKISNLSQEEWKIQFHTPRDFISAEVNARFPRTVLEPGDLVMAARGATIGKTAYVTPEFAGFNINPNLLRLKPNATRLIGKYFWYFMRCNAGQSQFQELVTSTAKQTITVPKLKSILMPLPSVTKQHRIVAELDELQMQVDALKKLQANTAAELAALLPSLLDKAFKGEL
jgi:type I restriction enzyme S subunit